MHPTPTFPQLWFSCSEAVGKAVPDFLMKVFAMGLPNCKIVGAPEWANSSFDVKNGRYVTGVRDDHTAMMLVPAPDEIIKILQKVCNIAACFVPTHCPHLSTQKGIRPSTHEYSYYTSLALRKPNDT
jgi:hypothetical protein